jgi:hypothetical protein
MADVTLAYAAGVADGSDWDLDGFDSIEEAANQAEGWDVSTINAMGATWCAKRWGVQEETDEWGAACDEYNRGVVAALRARLS